MKILVTGANGYLGQGVVKALLDNGHSVVAADFKTNYVDRKDSRLSISFRASFAAVVVGRTWCGARCRKMERNIFICTASQTTMV